MAELFTTHESRDNARVLGQMDKQTEALSGMLFGLKIQQAPGVYSTQTERKQSHSINTTQFRLCGNLVVKFKSAERREAFRVGRAGGGDWRAAV